MKFAVSVLDRAWSDADCIFKWIAARSPQGAAQWNAAFDAAFDEIEQNADAHSVAPESSSLGIAIREKLFKTRRGRPYRLLFMIEGNDVRVMRVRGPGQAPITTEDIAE